jgi:hypothetical protein
MAGDIIPFMDFAVFTLNNRDVDGNHRMAGGEDIRQALQSNHKRQSHVFFDRSAGVTLPILVSVPEASREIK